MDFTDGYKGTLRNIKERHKLHAELKVECQKLSISLCRQVDPNEFLHFKLDKNAISDQPSVLHMYHGYMAKCMLERAEEEEDFIRHQLVALHSQYWKITKYFESEHNSNQHWFKRLRCGQLAFECMKRIDECQELSIRTNIRLETHEL